MSMTSEYYSIYKEYLVEVPNARYDGTMPDYVLREDAPEESKIAFAKMKALQEKATKENVRI